MGNKAALIVSVLFLVFFFGCAAQPPAVPLQNNSLPSPPATTHVAAPAIKGPASDAVVFKVIDSENATKALLSGEIGYYMDSIPAADAARLQNDARVTLHPATSTIYGFYVNPAPAPVGSLNPFAIQKVRFALQYLVDRNEVVNKAFSGLATPTVTDPWPGHPAFEPIRSTVDSYGIKADKAKALSLISEAMAAAGATNQSGTWKFMGKPVAIKIYTYDSGTHAIVTSIIADSLREAGFVVNVTSVDRNAPDSAFAPYSTDPAKLEWHLAPSGYIFYDSSRHMAASVLGMDATEAGWWQYNNTAISDLQEKMRDCKDDAEWNALDRALAALLINDSTGIWLAAPGSTYAARREVLGLEEDKFVGIRTYPNIREAYVPGKKTLALGTPGIYYEGDPWNPVVINNIYAMDVVNSIYDPAVRSNTVTLEKEGFRWGFEIQGSQSASIPVPSDAFTWNYTAKKWVSVGSGKIATAKVTYDLSNYIGAKWHHGQNITWADALYFLASTWDRSFDARKLEISSPRWKPAFDSIVGMKISGNSLEVYMNEWNVDKDEMVTVARMFQRSAPLEEYAAMDSVVFGGANFTYQYGESERNIPSLNLLNESQVQEVLLAAHKLTLAEISPLVTVGGKTYLTQSELSARVAALDSWNAAHGHLVINDGPFYFDHYDSKDGSVYLTAFRDSGYPFSPGHWKQK